MSESSTALPHSVSGLTARFCTLAVVALMAASVGSFESYAHRPVLDRWSHQVAGVFAGLVAVWLGLVIHTVRRLPQIKQRSVPLWTGPGWLRLAVVVWAVGYGIRWTENPNVVGDLLNLDVIATASPLVLCLEGLALMCGFVGFVMVAGRHHQSKWFNYLLPLLAVVGAVTVLELIARVALVVSPNTRGFPTVSGLLWDRRYVTLNNHGFRGAPVPDSAATEGRRLLVIGDSYVYGWGVRDPADRFGEQLAARMDGPWHVVTAAQPGADTRQHIRLLEQYTDHRPDVVVLVYVFNDIEYLSGTPERTVITEAPRTIFERLHPLRLAVKNFVIVQEAFVRLRPMVYKPHSLPEREDPYSNPNFVSEHLVDLTSFVERAQALGSVVTIVPFDVAVADHEWAKERYRKFVDRATEHGLPVTPIADVFNGLESARLQVNDFDSHPNEAAHAMAAEAVALALGPRISAQGL